MRLGFKEMSRKISLILALVERHLLTSKHILIGCICFDYPNSLILVLRQQLAKLPQ